MNETIPDSAEDAVRIRNAELDARYVAIELEMEAAPYSKVGTYWWDERLKEMKLIKYRRSR